jgi:hypothetical protein
MCTVQFRRCGRLVGLVRGCVVRRRRKCLGVHSMALTAIVGWFVCEDCSLVAVCPGCVSVVPEGVVRAYCLEHGKLLDEVGTMLLFQDGQVSKIW